MAEMHEVILRVHLSNSCCPWRRSPSTHNTWTPPTTQCCVTKLKGTRLTGAAAAFVTAAGQPIPARTPSLQMSAQRLSPHPTPPSLPTTLWQLPSAPAASGGAGSSQRWQPRAAAHQAAHQPPKHPGSQPAWRPASQPLKAAPSRSRPLKAAQGRARTPKVAECRSRLLRAAQACKSASQPGIRSI